MNSPLKTLSTGRLAALVRLGLPLRLAAGREMTRATGNIYCGLHEFADIGFVLHLLRAGDLSVDVGANIDS
jgi:hypothetical protein